MSTNHSNSFFLIKLSVQVLVCLAVLVGALWLGRPGKADPLSPELIPPDVTLSPHAGKPTPSKAAQDSAPGLSKGKPAPLSVGRGQYGGGIPHGMKKPPAPPAGSSAKFSGFQTPPGGYPPGTQGAAQQNQGKTQEKRDPLATIVTEKGTITIRLFRKFAPRTVGAFVEMVNKGFYNGLNFHRVEPGFVIQGGCPNGNGSGMYIDPQTNQPRMLILETHAKLKHNSAGVVAMARFPKNPNSASCQFYITLKAQPSLDHKYTIFGGVIDGMDVVNQIRKGDKINSITIQEQP